MKQAMRVSPGLASSLLVLVDVLSALLLVYVLVAGFSLPAVLLGILFFVVMLSTEFLFSTKVGDLGKMRDEFKKQLPTRDVAGYSV